MFSPPSQLSSLGGGAFATAVLTEVVLPARLEAIGERCFHPCIALAGVTFSTGSLLREIGRYGFSRCPIQGLAVPASVRIIGDFSFAFCEDLNNLQFVRGDRQLTGLEVIGHGAFFNCPLQLHDLQIPPTVKAIGEFCFDARRPFTDGPSVELHEAALTAMSPHAFANRPCRAIVLPPGVSQIGAFCFADCISRETVVLNNELVALGPGCFARCSLASVRIPHNTKVIGDLCFAHCRALREVIFDRESTLARIDAFAFCETGLQAVAIPRTVEKLGQGCFRRCSALMRVEFGEPSQLTAIEAEAFAETAALSSAVTLPATLTFIGSGLFTGSDVQIVRFAPDSALTAIGFSPFAASKLREFVIPSSVTNATLAISALNPRLRRISTVDEAA
jgi:hypothetical protein